MGHPGSGKSVLVKALADACPTHAKCSEDQVATFFFDARGSADQKSMLGLLKTLLFQLLPMCAKTRNYFTNLYKLEVCRVDEDAAEHWNVRDLRDVLLRFCSVQRDTPIYIFIDAVDECEDIENKVTNARSFADFLQDLADTSYDSDSNVNICVSSRRHPTVKIRYCAEILVDVKNRGDIELYVSGQLQQYGFAPSEMHKVKDSLTSKAEGVFLWARLVLSSITQSFDAGLNMDVPSVLRYLHKVPETLYKMFDRILERLSFPERLKALRLFQWAVLAQRPLSANEWVHILAFVDEPDLHSIKKWREGKYGVRDMEQLAKRLRNMTGGLLEVVLQEVSQEDNHSRPISLVSIGSARAGSMETYGSATFVVQFMHLSACQYFLSGKGFKLLGEVAPPACFGAGHIYIAATCLRYAQLDEIKPLILSRSSSVEASSEATSSSGKQSKRQRRKSDTNLSVVSFGSSAAYSVRRRSLPASAPSSPSADNAASDDLFGKWHPQLTREMLETHLRGLDPPEVLSKEKSEEDAPSRFEPLETSQPESLGPFDSFSEHANILSAHTTNAMFLDDPVLRLYAMEMFVHHAAAANKVDADPSELLDMIHGEQKVANDCWYKWCQLNDDDDLRSDTTPTYFAAERDWKTWIEWYAKSSSYRCRQMLTSRGGDMRYPLLAAIFWGHGSIVACLSDYVDTEIPVNDPWALLHYLAANKIKADATLARRRLSQDLIDKLLSLCANVLSTEAFVVGVWPRFYSYMMKYGVRVREFESMLVRIQALSSPVESLGESELGHEDTAELFLDDVFLRAGLWS
jgi:hypothetical protein